MTDCPMALKVVSKVSFSKPQVVPDNDFKMLLRDLTLDLTLVAWCLKVNKLSKVTPRNFGCWTDGTEMPLMEILSFFLFSLDQVVKTVAVDLAGEINKFLSLNQLSRVSRYALISIQIGSRN